jgi:hypothetical protein
MISECCNLSNRYNVKISFIYCAHFFFVGAFFIFERTDTLGDRTVRRGRTPSATEQSEEDGHPRRQNSQKRTDTLGDRTVRRGRTPSATEQSEEDGHPRRFLKDCTVNSSIPLALSKNLLI